MSSRSNEVYFSRKSNTDDYIPINLNDSPVQLCGSQKHLGFTLDKHLSFYEHIERKFKTCRKLIGTIKHWSFQLLKKCLLIIYKSFVQPHLHYGDIIYDNPVNELLMNKLERAQYNHTWQVQIPFKARNVRVFTRNLDLNFYKVGVRIGKWYFFIKY